MSKAKTRRKAERMAAAGRREQRRRTRNIAIGVGVAVGFVGLIVAASLRGGTGSSPSDVQTDGVTFRYLDGREGSIADFEGTPVVFNFFASWCGPCWQEMPGFERVWQERRGEVQFIGVALQDAPDAIQTILQRTGVSYPIVEDPNGSIFQQLGGRGMPTTVFFDAQGSVFRHQTGEITADRLSEMIDDLVEA